MNDEICLCLQYKKRLTHFSLEPLFFSSPYIPSDTNIAKIYFFGLLAWHMDGVRIDFCNSDYSCRIIHSANENHYLWFSYVSPFTILSLYEFSRDLFACCQRNQKWNEWCLAVFCRRTNFYCMKERKTKFYVVKMITKRAISNEICPEFWIIWICVRKSAQSIRYVRMYYKE